MITLQQKQIWRLQEQQQKKEKHVTSTAATGKTNDYLQSRHSALNYRSGEKIKSTLTQLSDPGRTGKKIIF